ncbi:uncharacterized protein NPIL_607161 [Nephila pilipes]|uniref:Uncharacterized protein n=1 Tax=Nephila pilipes TaxID=299642 RepID=A0A8X6MKH8_NEPPI|nr:uncharacterized protein NPIL_607161 [Nephila pilipes]
MDFLKALQFSGLLFVNNFIRIVIDTMETYVFVISILLLTSGTTLGKQDNGNDLDNGNNSSRNSRKYDNFFNKANFPDKSTSTEDTSKPVYSDAGSEAAKPSRGDDQYPAFNVYKGYDKTPSFDQKHYPVINSYKGFPYYPKGEFAKPEDGGIAFPTEEQLMEMMMMMNAMNKLQISPKKDEQGFLAKLMMDPKTYMLAAIVPLVIMIASFLPMLANYMMSGPSMPSVVTTIANSKMARAVRDSDLAEKVLENLMEFGTKVLEGDDCIQQAICEIALSQGGLENMRSVAFIAKRIGKEKWLENWGAKELVSALESSSCDNVCSKKISTKRQ